VQHWAFRVASYKAGLKVFTVSQLGDLPLFCFFFLMLGQFGTTDMAEILSGLPLALFDVLRVGSVLVGFCEAAAALLSAAVFLKAAQFIFYP
jgi:NADH:ubiquinone oxidoreductase subunit 5 (subunit L)/multisubunit Na+/H+ antiporter MnhA subunit